MARILIIDDDKQLRSVVRLALEMTGHEVDEAADGAEGIKIYRQQPADVILCDLLMPGKEGLETIIELRREYGDVKIIAMSGGAYGGAISFLPLAQKLGAAKILKKPFDGKTLSAAIEEVLQSPSGGAAKPVAGATPA